MPKSTDETLVIPKDAMLEALKQPCKFKSMWTVKELSALKQCCDPDWKTMVSYRQIMLLINRYARESGKPPRTVGQIRNKLDDLRVKCERNV